jgi:spore coat protein CotH
MRATVWGILATIGAFAALAAPASAASPADWMYEPSTFTEVKLTLPQASYELLQNVEYDEYVQGTFELAETGGTPGTAGTFSTPITVGIKLKGGLGSRRSIDEKAGLKISFGKFVKGQTFLGLEKMTLNNMVQDPSMEHEVLAYHAFRQMGVYAPHTGYSYVWVNGKSYGLHLNLETLDKVALGKQFGPFQNPPQHLYEGEYGADVSTGTNPYTGHPRWEDFEVDEGKSGTKTDLTEFLAAVEGSTGSFSERVAAHADLAQMARMWLVEKYIGHWDGYSSSLPGHQLPNNYYLYSDPTGRFQLLPWGTDQTWSDHLDFDAPGGVLFAGCLNDTTGCLPLYRAAGEEALTKLQAADLDSLAATTAASTIPWREYEIDESEASKLPEYDLQQTLDEQDAAREFIAERPPELASFLASIAPPTPPDPPVLPDSPLMPPSTTPGSAATAPVDVLAAGAGTAPPPRFGRRAAGANAVGLELHSAAAGNLSLLGTFKTPRGRAIACRGAGAIGADGGATISCQLTAAFKRRLEGRAAYMQLTATLTPAAGPSTATTTTIRLPAR